MVLPRCSQHHLRTAYQGITPGTPPPGHHHQDAPTLGHHHGDSTTGASLPGLHHQGCTTGASPPGLHHQGCSTRTSPPGCSTTRAPPMALGASCAKSLPWSPCRSTEAAQFVVEEKGFVHRLQGIASLQRGMVSPRSLCWAAPKLLPPLLVQAAHTVTWVSPVPQAAKPHISTLVKDGQTSLSWEQYSGFHGTLKPTALLGDLHILQFMFLRRYKGLSPVRVNMFSVVAFGGATSPFCPCFLIHNICFLFRTFIFY